MGRLSDFAAWLKAHDDYAIFGHINPDGDASGSCIALCLALQALGKRAFVYLPGGIANMYAEIECTVPVASGSDLPFAPRTGFAVDISELKRMGAGYDIFMGCEHKAMLDHHETNPGFGDISFVDGEAAACGELVVELLPELGVEMNLEMATWLYVAICTDCGRFGYSSTRPETMIAAAECLRAGIDVDEIHRLLYRTRSEGRTRLLGLVLSNMEMNAEKTLCWARLTEEMRLQANALPEDREGIVNYLVEIQGVRIAFLAEERSVNVTKFSLRSKKPYNVATTICAPLGGGGHACAAGITLEMPMEEALEAVLAKAREALQ